MADTYLVKSWLPNGGPILQDQEWGEDLITFDSSITESHESTVLIPKHRVEKGVDVSDNTRRKSNIVTLQATLSDTPINGIDEDLPDRARTLYQHLIELQVSGEVVRLITGLKTYNNMQLERVSVPRDSSTGMQVICDLSFSETIYVEQAYTDIPERILRKDVKDKGQSKDDKGKQQTGEADNVSAVCQAYEGASIAWKIVHDCPLL